MKKNTKNNTVDFDTWKNFIIDKSHIHFRQFNDIEGARILSKYVAGYMIDTNCWYNEKCKSYEEKNFFSFDDIIKFFSTSKHKMFLYKMWWWPSTPRYILDKKNPLNIINIVYGHWEIYYTQF
jgi:hypothetical protein